jgi:ABC-type transport system involved in resistance to organic solvents, ATPase component
MALDPEILFFDEPSAGLDPISSRLLDDLILELRDSLGATIGVVTHELASIFAIGNNSIFLDADTKTMIAQGDPASCVTNAPTPRCAISCFGARSTRMRRRKRDETRREEHLMARKANSKLIGGFVVGATALSIVGMIVFGGGQFLKPKENLILFFQGSLAGLDVGSPVTFRGVSRQRDQHRH